MNALAKSARRIRGIVPPMVTPLRQPDELDCESLPRLVDHIIAGGVAGLFILGTTGEAPSLSYRLRYQLVEAVCEHVAGRLPVLVGITDSSFRESLELSQFAADCGASAVVAAPPYYFPMRPSDLSSYFLRLADESPLPLFLYNMPACTKVAIDLETTRTCLAHTNIIGFKDSGGELEFFRQLIALRDERSDWSLLVGPEHLTGEAVLCGGDGGVNGGANLFPRLFVDVFEAASRREHVRLSDLQNQVQALGKLYSVGGDFVSVARSLKCALSYFQICGDAMEHPFASYSNDQRERIRQLLFETPLDALAAPFLADVKRTDLKPG